MEWLENQAKQDSVVKKPSVSCKLPKLKRKSTPLPKQSEEHKRSQIRRDNENKNPGKEETRQENKRAKNEDTMKQQFERVKTERKDNKKD